MLEGLTLTSCMPPLEILRARTKWNTRGWTYQKAVIANRLLCITTNRIYYECKKGCKVHEGAMEEEVPPGTPGTKDIVFPYRIDAIQAGGDFATLEHILTEFTKRTFTDSNNVLNSLAGDLQSLAGNIRGLSLCIRTTNECIRRSTSVEAKIFLSPTHGCTGKDCFS